MGLENRQSTTSPEAKGPIPQDVHLRHGSSLDGFSPSAAGIITPEDWDALAGIMVQLGSFVRTKTAEGIRVASRKIRGE